MTLDIFLVLVSVMLLGGLLPSVSSLAVLSSSATSGFLYGIFISIGIVLSDITFVFSSIYGISILEKSFYALYELIIFIGGAYLIWLGTMYWQNEVENIEYKNSERESFVSAFIIGLLIPLKNKKNVVFYMSFPFLFFSLFEYSIVEGVLVIIAPMALIFAKFIYAYIGSRGYLFIKTSKVVVWINRAAGASVIFSGSFIILVN